MTNSFAEANRLQKAFRNFAASDLSAPIFRVTAHHLDKVVSRLTRGHKTLAGMLTGIPAVVLTTTGAKSGLPRTVPVLGIPHEEGLGVIASNFGSAKHPAWFHNLLAEPKATVTVGGERWDVTARVATPAERDELWRRGLEIYPGWRKYEVRSGDRQIEAFVLARDR